jgi:FkbM family methyltransferase
MSILNTLGFILNHPLNKGRSIDALVRFFRWQFGSRLMPGAIVYNWIDEAKFIVSQGETGLTGNVYCGLHEFEDMAYVLHVVDAEDVFIDVGANVGSYTILACGVKGAKGYCFEPIPQTFDRLVSNIRINNLSERVEAMNIGCSDAEKELVFTVGENAMNHVVSSDEKASGVVRVKTFPLDAILGQVNPTVIKIDVEGFETEVLTGAYGILNNKSLHSVIMELNGSGERYGFDEKMILDKMIGYGFSTYVYDPYSRELKSLDGKNNLSGNTLFIRDEILVREKIKKTPPILVAGVLL